MQINKVKDYSQLSHGELQLIHIREYFLNSAGCPFATFYLKKEPCTCTIDPILNYCRYHAHFDESHSTPCFSYRGGYYEFTKDKHPQYRTIFIKTHLYYQ